MLIKTHRDGFDHPLPSEITPQAAYQTRRTLMQRWAAGAGGAALASVATRQSFAQQARPGKLSPLPGAKSAVAGATTMEKVTDYKDATSYNNFYEFGTDKDDPAKNAHTLKVSPWSVEVEGMVKKPARYTLEDLLKLSAQEERVYRLRCVEGWSMVIPWVGYSLAELVRKVEPLPSAKYVEFLTLADPKTMPFVGSRVLDWPYREGLRMDEAMHPLTLLATGIYGKPLLQQNGAPLRLVVPWKYGFKSIKSIVRIDFVEKRPFTSWNDYASNEYGFFSNVNPAVDHPRWSQKTERRIAGTTTRLFADRIATRPFNGYGDQVASLYAGMDLRKWF